MKTPRHKVTTSEIDQAECCRLAKAARAESGLSFARLADLLGFSAPYLHDLELGRRGWSEITFNRWLEACKKVK